MILDCEHSFKSECQDKIADHHSHISSVPGGLGGGEGGFKSLYK